MVQSCKSDQAFQIGPGSGLSLSKFFRPAYKTFYGIRSNNFFLSWRRFVVLTAITSVNEVIVIFSADSVCKHSCVLFFSAWINLTLFLRRQL